MNVYSFSDCRITEPDGQCRIVRIGMIIVLTIPDLAQNAKYLTPVVIGCSLLITPFISWFMAPHMRNRYWQNRNHKTGSF